MTHNKIFIKNNIKKKKLTKINPWDIGVSKVEERPFYINLSLLLQLFLFLVLLLLILLLVLLLLWPLTRTTSIGIFTRPMAALIRPTVEVDLPQWSEDQWYQERYNSAAFTFPQRIHRQPCCRMVQLSISKDAKQDEAALEAGVITKWSFGSRKLVQF